jgi:hypothetical protein
LGGEYDTYGGTKIAYRVYFGKHEVKRLILRYTHISDRIILKVLLKRWDEKAEIRDK